MAVMVEEGKEKKGSNDNVDESIKKKLRKTNN